MTYIIVSLAALLLLVFFLYRFYKKNRYSQLYIEAVRHENQGSYSDAIEKYTEAMNEIINLKRNRKELDAIAKRIKTLHTLMAYENKFQRDPV